MQFSQNTQKLIENKKIHNIIPRVTPRPSNFIEKAFMQITMPHFIKFWIISIALTLSVMPLGYSGVSPVGEEHFYKGNYAAPGDYILNGGLIKDLPDAIEVPVHYDAPSFDASKLTPPPKPGIHPRILIGPDDIESFKKLHASGMKAPRIFRMQMEQMRRDAENWKVPMNFKYRTSPWGEDSKIAGWGLYALITENDTLGKKAADATVEHALYLEGRIDILNSDPVAAPIKDVAYDFIRKEVVFGQIDYHDAYYQGGKERVAELYKKHGATLKGYDFSGAHLSLAFEYDYAQPFMTEEQSSIVRRVISKCTYGKYTTGMQIPGHMYINNHMSGGANQTYLALAIEGEEGYDPRVAKLAEWSLKNKLSYDLSSDGITYENTKGFIPMLPVLAIAKRQGAEHPENLLKHSHLLARANSNVQRARKIYHRYFAETRRRPDAKNLDKITTGYDEKRYWRASGGSGSGGHLEFWSVMKHFYPSDKMVDFVWNTKLPESLEYYEGKPEDNWKGKLHRNWFGLKAINLLTATKMTNYNKLDRLDFFENADKFWFDDERGMMCARNDWSGDSMIVHKENRTDQYYMGHESPQHGDFQVWADGIPWITNAGAYLDTNFRTMVTVDGLAGVYAPISGDWMTASHTELTATSVSEMTSAYQWRKSKNALRYLDHPGLDQAPYQMKTFANGAYELNRYSEFAFLPKIREHYDGFAHLDYGPWHGETRGPEYYIKWNDPMEHVFRTIHFARGEKPYLLIMDDLRKADDKNHQFDWRMLLTGDAVVYDITTAAGKRHLHRGTEGAIGTDMLFCMADDQNKRANENRAWGVKYVTLKPKPKKGDPMLLVRVLWRNTNAPYPAPNAQRSFAFNMISIPAFGKSPEYRVMVFPHRFGDAMPITEWSDDRSRLTIKVGDHVDTYDFDQTDRERTVFSMSRNGMKVMDSNAKPPKPELIENRRFTPDLNRLNWRPERLINGKEKVRFASQKPGTEIRYTLDGSTPDLHSPIYSKAISIDHSCTLKARSFRQDWRFGKGGWSDTVEFKYRLAKSQESKKINNLGSGLRLKAYEVKTTEFDKKGFMQGRKKSLPDLSKQSVLHEELTNGLIIPELKGKHPGKYMMKGFYHFEGYIHLNDSGVHSFELNSCGPIDFKIGNQQIILVDEQYGLSYKARYGEASLDKGWHEFSLILCDPMFWKGDLEGAYDISLKTLTPSSDQYVMVSNSNFAQPSGINAISHDTSITNLKESVKHIAVTPGLLEERFDRLDFLLENAPSSRNTHSEASFIPASGLSTQYFDALGIKPYQVQFSEIMQQNPSPRKMVQYKGFIRIARDGSYTFSLKEGRNSSARLYIANQLVSQRQVDAKKVKGTVHLEAGLHTFRLQLAMGQPVVYMQHEDEDHPQILHPGALCRAKNTALPEVEGAQGAHIPGLIGIITGEKITGETTPVEQSDGAVALVTGASVIDDGVKGKALSFNSEIAGLTMKNLKQREDEFTISTWVRFKNNPQDIYLWGQAYGSLNLRVRSNRFIMDWSRGIGLVDWRSDIKEVAAGKWFHVSATYCRLSNSDRKVGHIIRRMIF
jgi:hypothetical protein